MWLPRILDDFFALLTLASALWFESQLSLEHILDGVLAPRIRYVRVMKLNGSFSTQYSLVVCLGAMALHSKTDFLKVIV